MRVSTHLVLTSNTEMHTALLKLLTYSFSWPVGREVEEVGRCAISGLFENDKMRYLSKPEIKKKNSIKNTGAQPKKSAYHN